MGCGAEQLSLSIALLDDTIRSSPKSQWDCRCETKRYRAVAEESELQLKRFTLGVGYQPSVLDRERWLR